MEMNVFKILDHFFFETKIDNKSKGWSNFLTRWPQLVIKFDRVAAATATDGWSGFGDPPKQKVAFKAFTEMISETKR